MRHHAFVIEGEIETGVLRAQEWITQELGLEPLANPDMIILRYGLFSVEDARRVFDVAAQAPLRGESKALVIAATRVYHESQNALLKLFEEPPKGTYLFLIVPSVGSLLPTLRSRVQVLSANSKQDAVGEIAKEFLEASSDKRTAMIKKLSTGKDEEERREHRDAALALVNDIERVAYQDVVRNEALLTDIATLRSYLYERSASVKMILEHLSIVTPKNLLH